MSNEKRETIVVMNSATWESIKIRTIEEALDKDDPIDYILLHDINVVIDDDLEDKIVQAWFRDAYEAYLEMGNVDDED